MTALMNSNIGQLELVSKGKVRDIYVTPSPDHLLFVATDRISAYDVILKNGIPDKGKILTELSLFWFDKLKDIIPNHVVTCRIEDMPEVFQQHKEQLDRRSILVRKAKLFPSRPSYVDTSPPGSAWAEYQKSRTVHGIPLPDGLLESEKFPKPLFTPSTKAEQGAHDENISPERAAALIGQELYDRVSDVSIRLYTAAAEYAATRGLIIADTKFEFGLVDGQLILIDEALTPDSSRYWPQEGYAPGRNQPSFDKQYVRDWLASQGFRKGLEDGPDGQGWTMNDEVVRGTRERYLSGRDMLLK
ncbi:phosphoribosylaminoimidazole-succinocarboxamide synthase [Multifurca ochricompacta]|uniref:Phosphoribosylaminoimidazole-succinocarboxamide synthase n=1 Tax=Multifurca ochricompacta TaxID=376703 RepID=A0AAD4MBJ6_9AGAM|nr:phosphoribosylaminoimidazole-succinocarboxamide synthase [Multifurca ochricompacta]